MLAQSWIDYKPDIVKINNNAITELRFHGEKNIVLSDGENKVLMNNNVNEVIQYLIVLNSINYQFLDVKDGIFTRYENNGLVGALAMDEGFDNFYKFMKSVKFNTAYISAEKMLQ